MQAVLIVLPILVFGLLTAILLAWVLLVTLPRIRRAERNAPRETPVMPGARHAVHGETRIVDTDQQAISSHG